ncbi:MAG TPA: protease complex subunit PrcB family protein [Gemmatimonadales bacterium]
MRRFLPLLAALWLSCSDLVHNGIPADTDLVPFDSLDGLFGGSRIASQWNGGQARLVLRDQAAWAEVYTQATGNPDAQTISFTDRAVFFAATGAKQSTGHDITIDEVRKDREGRLYIVVREIRPGTGCGLQATPTSPVTAIRTINVYTVVVYIERPEVDPCTVS